MTPELFGVLALLAAAISAVQTYRTKGAAEVFWAWATVLWLLAITISFLVACGPPR